jgi:hypothetical protein
MQTQTQPPRPGLRARAVPGRHVKGTSRTRRILIAALMLSGLAAGSVAASGVTGGHPDSHHKQSAVSGVRNPWMY